MHRPTLPLLVLLLACAHCGPPFTESGGPGLLASGESLPRGIAVDDTNLYWVDAEDSAGGKGLVRAMPKDGSSSPTTLASDQTAPLDVALGGGQVFWSVGTGTMPSGPQCLVMRLEASGAGDPVCLVSGPLMTSRIALNSTSMVVLGQGAMNDSYFTFVPMNGGMPATPVMAQGRSQAIVASDTDIYLGNANGTHVDDYSLSNLDFGPAVCEGGCGMGTLVDLAIDTTLGHVIWATSDGDVFLGEIPPNSPEVVSLATLAGTPQRIARDASYVYIATQDPGTIWAVPLSGGGKPIALAQGEDAPFAIAVDAAYVYWTCGDGTIRSVAVP